MSENENVVNENENEATEVVENTAADTTAEVDAAETVKETAEESAEDFEEPSVNYDEELMDKAQKAARLLRSRRYAMGAEEEARAERMNDLKRALKLLELKPEMEQKEISDLLGMRLRELDALLAEAEEADLVARVVPEDEDMRKVVVRVAEDTEDGLAKLANKKEKLLPSLSADEMVELMAALDKIIAPLVAMGLDRDDDRRGGDRGGRGGFGGRDDRGGRGGDRGGRGGRGGFGDRGGRGGDRGGRGGDRGGRGGFGGRDDRGGRGGDRGGRGGFGGSRGGYGDRGGRGGYGDRGGRGGRGGDHGGRNGGGFRGNRF